MWLGSDLCVLLEKITPRVLPALPCQPGAHSSRFSSSSGFSQPFHRSTAALAQGGQSPINTGAPLSSAALGFLLIRIDGKRGHLPFAEAVGYIGRKPVKPAFIE